MESYLYLLQIFGGGNPKIHKVIEYYGSVIKAADKISHGDTTLLSENRKTAMQNASMKRSAEIIRYCRKRGIRIITIEDFDYPALLKNIYNPPTVLFVQGSLNCLKNTVCVACVGPRNPDKYAERLGAGICRCLSRCGVVTVSGFARGIDSIVYQCALEENQATVAVLACGHAVEYPAYSFAQRDRVIKCGGAVISELLPETPCAAGYFKYRNRIISGLSHGTLVIGADNKSGSMLTARHALQQDRDLFFTVPADTMNPRYSSVVKYIRDGAGIAFDAYDIINEYYGRYPDRIKTLHLDESKLTSYHTDFDESDETELRKGIDEADESAECQETDVGLQVSEETRGDTFEDIKPEPEKEPPQDNKVSQSAEKPLRTPPRKPLLSSLFRFRVNVDKTGEELSYKQNIPEYAAKKKGRVPNTPSQIRKDNNEGTVYAAKSDIQPSEHFELSERDALRADILGIIKKQNGASLDLILREANADFADVTEILADMEIDGAVSCKAGNTYFIS